jgi:hypothetical protein
MNPPAGLQSGAMLDFFIGGLAHVLVPMFLIGMGGSAIVVAVTVVHDVHDFFADTGDDAASDSLS